MAGEDLVADFRLQSKCNFKLGVLGIGLRG